MRLSNLVALACAASPVFCTLHKRQNGTVDEIDAFQPSDEVAELAQEGLAQLLQLDSGISSRSTQCKLSNIVIRRDW
jgi:hypothetical protein